MSDLVPLGLKIPYRRDDVFGYFAQITNTRERYNTNLKMLLMTAKGERPIMPNYGSNLRSILFEPNSPDHVDSLMEDAITEAVEEWLPEIMVEGVDVTRDHVNTPHSATIRIDYTIINIPGSNEEPEITVES